jgi:hypothetical protein
MDKLHTEGINESTYSKYHFGDQSSNVRQARHTEGIQIIRIV